MDSLAVVICHGSYHTPAPYQPLVDALKAKGIDAYCPQLPTADLTKLNVGDDIENPDFDLGPPAAGYPQGEEDAEVVTNVLNRVVKEQGKDVLVVGHSSGGWVATQAAQPELQAKIRRQKGEAGGIVGILYIGAFVLPVGESVNSYFQPKDGTLVTPSFMQFHKHGAAGLGTIVQAEKFLFNDLDPVQARKWAAGLTASPILTTKLTNNVYKDLPCAYLVLEGDLTLPVKYQESMIVQQSAYVADFQIYRSPAGHSPHLSWTNGVVDVVQDFANKTRL